MLGISGEVWHAKKGCRTQNHTNEGVVVCSACVVWNRKYAEHEITPVKVWFRPRRVQEVFLEKADEEDFLLIMSTVINLKRYMKKARTFVRGWA